MAHLGAWLISAATIAVLLRRRPIVTVAIALVLWTLLPAVAAHRITGSRSGPLATHPSTWLVIVQLGVCAVADARPIITAICRRALLTIVLAMFIVGALAVSVLNGSGGARLLADQVVGPAVAFALIVAYSTSSISPAMMLRTLIVALGVAQSLLALLQSALGRTIVFQNDFARIYWFNPDRFDRWMGSTDHPLVLSLLISTAAILVVGLRFGPVIRGGLLVVLSLGAVTTQSRVGVVIVGCAIIYFILFSRISLATRIVSFTLVALSARAVLRSDLVTGVSSRLSDDTGSAAARRRALDFFFDHLDTVAWAGHGLTSNYEVARAGGLQTSLESTFMMYVVDVGLPLAVLYFSAQLVLVLGHMHANRIAGAAPAALVGIFVQHTFSALGYSNMTGFLIWSVIGITVVGSRRGGAEQPTPQVSARRSTAMSSSV